MTMSVPAERCAKTAYTLHGRRPRITHAGLVGPAGAALFLDIDKKGDLPALLFIPKCISAYEYERKCLHLPYPCS